MTKALTRWERSGRQRTMAQFRNWIAQHGFERQRIADDLGITAGHLRTLLNLNRTATEDQCQKAMILMDAKFAVSKHDPRYEEFDVEPLVKREEMRPKPKRKAKRKPNNLRPLTKFEATFVKELAESWLSNNKGAGPDEFVKMVRAISIGIRS